MYQVLSVIAIMYQVIAIMYQVIAIMYQVIAIMYYESHFSGVNTFCGRTENSIRCIGR